MSRIEQIEPTSTGWSKWSIWPRKVRHICCDCNNSHDVEMKVSKGKIWMRWRTNHHSTSALRRKF